MSDSIDLATTVIRLARHFGSIHGCQYLNLGSDEFVKETNPDLKDLEFQNVSKPSKPSTAQKETIN